jgi:hypothetical protein
MHSAQRAQSISPEKTNRQRQPCMQAHESVEDSDQCQVNTSPEFKGIKTFLLVKHKCHIEVNTSPEFKGIKTERSRQAQKAQRKKIQALN